MAPPGKSQCVTEHLEQALCLFVGTSLADPNLVRYLYGYRQSPSRRHAAVFVREGDLDGDSDQVRAARERAAARRWGRCGVDCVFVDHFADAAQMLYEIGYRRDTVGSYLPVGRRARSAIAQVEVSLVLARASQVRFAERQIALSRWLREALRDALRLAFDMRQTQRERFGLALWLLSRDGQSLTAWAHSDRAHQDPATIEAVPIRSDSAWVAVRAICQGVRVERETDSETSRWRFIRALPLIIDRPTRLPIGCLTIASTNPHGRSVLGTASQRALWELHRSLIDAIQPRITSIAETAAMTIHGNG